jgi:hypothetical protein
MYYISTHKRCKYNSEKYIYFSIYSIKRKNALFEVLSYGYPMGMLWLSYGKERCFDTKGIIWYGW